MSAPATPFFDHPSGRVITVALMAILLQVPPHLAGFAAGLDSFLKQGIGTTVSPGHSSGLLTKPQSGFQGVGKLHVASATVDFAF